MSSESVVRRVVERGYWREAEARVVVEAWRESGEELSRFARQQGVDPRRLSRWARRLGVERGRSPRFHPVRLVGTAAAIENGVPIEIELATGQRIIVPHGFATDDLHRVLALLAGLA